YADRVGRAVRRRSGGPAIDSPNADASTTSVVRIWIDETRRIRAEVGVSDETGVHASTVMCEGHHESSTGGRCRLGAAEVHVGNLFPRGRLEGVAMELRGRRTVAGRPVFVLGATPEPQIHFPPVIRETLGFSDADERELLVDVQRGIVLGMTDRAQGEE